MLKLKITNFSNAAMAEDPRAAVAEILRKTAEKIENGVDYGPLMDYNGNKVGEWSLTLEEEDN